LSAIIGNRKSSGGFSGLFLALKLDEGLFLVYDFIFSRGKIERINQEKL